MLSESYLHVVARFLAIGVVQVHDSVARLCRHVVVALKVSLHLDSALAAEAATSI